MLKKDNLIFSCKMGVTFHAGNEDPYTIWLYDCDPKPENEYCFINPTINGASTWLSKRLVNIILEIQKRQQLPDNSFLHDQEKA